ncbi:EscS/YscS/HrcS family type III secretion system export apparatus protein [Duganella sp. BJB488]|uniref:type III secretion system export apparatus subunit SctS n=1 Tax=unclassified Duganella TaxID=2636909 RepID=UPI000E344B23|nr:MULTISPECIES: type III secretion system export apparatus subunit SctS [unclassified Duganella]RFP09352.1 EscS/YscS/HrcS family type III secretion system export apparatus protein [Duganella sp. BJB475]RFP13240.1 EscS/YscS/HrcS family type III secretion system export apparatus protein [Duganella sp. BJB489]RFP17185.1 EscS/YscS/HrcS family type III secretion system export apparatus protein [Duganella sp. BJB488]RFP25388.1 EscS/YscS/HrcS family type III secretion system export apparatus protein 
MDYDTIGRLTSAAMTLCLLVSLPAVLAAALIGLLVSFLQAVTSLQDSSISHGIKLIVVTVVIMLAAPWGASAILQFARNIMQTIFL